MLVQEQAGTFDRPKRGGIKAKVAGYCSSRFNRNIAAALWTEDTDLLQLSKRVPVENTLLMLIRSYNAEKHTLSRYSCVPDVETDGRIYIGPNTLDQVFNLQLPYQSKNVPGYLATKVHKTEARAAARMIGPLEQASARQLVPEQSLLMPEPWYGFDHKLPIQVSPSLTVQTRLRFKLSPGEEPIREQLLTTWDEASDPYTHDGKPYFLYPARYILLSDKLDYATHPRTGETPPETTAERDGVKHREWFWSLDRWVPAIPSGASVWFNGRSVTGREYRNPAFSVLSDAGIITLPFDEFLTDLAAQEDAQKKYGDLQSEARDVLNIQARSRARQGVVFSDRDIEDAMIEPCNPLVATHDSIVSVFWTNNLSARFGAWDIDFASMPEHFASILGSK